MCFETLHGNIESGVAQMESGLRLLREHIDGRSNNADNCTPPGSDFTENEVLQALSRLDGRAITDAILESHHTIYHQVADVFDNSESLLVETPFNSASFIGCPDFM